MRLLGTVLHGANLTECLATVKTVNDFKSLLLSLSIVLFQEIKKVMLCSFSRVVNDWNAIDTHAKAIRKRDGITSSPAYSDIRNNLQFLTTKRRINV